MKAMILPVVLGALTIAGCGKKPDEAPATMTSGKPSTTASAAAAKPTAMATATATTSASAAAPVKPPSKGDQIEALDSVERAIAFARSDMSDAVDTESPGETLLGRWASKKMKFNDVEVAKDETSFDAIEKDAGAERGKRFCVKGPIAKIEVAHTDAGDVGTGSLLAGGKHVAYFKAVGDRGDLAAKKAARFCGVVIGKYDYKNASRETSHAVAIVGMFDTPGNKKK